MKKKPFTLLVALASAVLMLTGCEGFLRMDKWKDSVVTDSMAVEATETKAPDAPPAPQEKTVKYEIKNVSGTSYILDSGAAPYEVSDAYGISDFTVEADSSVKSRLSSDEEDRVIETSPTTYEIVITLVWANIPTDKDELEMNQTEGPFYTQDLKITGTYNKYAVIEWDGSSFKQTS